MEIRRNRGIEGRLSNPEHDIDKIRRDEAKESKVSEYKKNQMLDPEKSLRLMQQRDKEMALAAIALQDFK